jgi:hypothetical protein
MLQQENNFYSHPFNSGVYVWFPRQVLSCIDFALQTKSNHFLIPSAYRHHHFLCWVHDALNNTILGAPVSHTFFTVNKTYSIKPIVCRHVIAVAFASAISLALKTI